MEVKVLHVLRTYLPETENWLYHLLNNTNNVQHTMYCEKYSPGIFESKKFRFIPLPSRYEPDFGNTILGKLNRYFHAIRLRLSGKTKQEFLSYLTASERPDIIHFHFGTMALAYESVFMKIKTPFIVSFYGYDYNPTYNYKKVFTKATTVICEGRAGKEQLLALGCPEDKIEIVPLGIIPVENIPRKNKPPGQLNLVQIASFTEKKGQMYAVQAVEKALESCPKITLTLMGPDSPLKSYIGDYVRQKKLGLNITIKDAISPPLLSEELHKYDVFIHPSILAANGDNEGGAPVVLLNAQNCGLPVISTTHRDIPSYVLHEKTGILSQEKKVNDLAESIIKFYKMHSDEYQVYSKNAILHVTQNYNIENNARNLFDLYHQMINI